MKAAARVEKRPAAVAQDDPEAERLDFVLEVYAGLIREELRKELVGLERLSAPVGVARSVTRAEDLTDALKKVSAARVELARCPEGAHLAFLVLGFQLDRVRLDLENLKRREQGSVTGRQRAKAKKATRLQRRNAQFLRYAATLPADLSALAKAKIVARKFPKLTVRHLRRLIQK